VRREVASTYADGYLKVGGVTPGCHVLTTDVSSVAEDDARLTSMCAGGYHPLPRWSATQTFNTGDQVTYQGALWQALWWTQNKQSGDPTGPWEELATAPDGTAIWTATRVFTKGDVVLYEGHRYQAKWWTRNQAPGDPNGPWQPLA